MREGTITENTSYYIFTQCADDAFEAFPIEEWYNFQPVIRYKYLNVDEAEEEFSRLVVERDRGAAGSSLTGFAVLWSLSKTHLS